MATADSSSANYREWFEGPKAKHVPGQLDLLGTVGAEPDSPLSEPKDEKRPQSQAKQRRRRGKGAPPARSAPERPASLQRPPKRPLTVAEVVARRLEANDRGQRANH